jgi:hypothetical protein
MPVLVLPPRYTPDSVALWRAAIQLGWDVCRVQGRQMPDGLREQDPVLYGETMFARWAADELDLALLEPSLDWLTTLPQTYLQRSVRALTLADVRRIAGPAFIKPADEKEFPAQVYTSGDEVPELEWLPPDTPVLISDPVVWEVEYRCVVMDRAVVTLSPYLRNGELIDPDEETSPEEAEAARQFSGSLLADPRVEAPPAFILDVGRLAGGAWAVVEANPVWGAGLYQCNALEVLPVLRRASVSRPRLPGDDRRWVLA